LPKKGMGAKIGGSYPDHIEIGAIILFTQGTPEIWETIGTKYVRTLDTIKSAPSVICKRSSILL